MALRRVLERDATRKAAAAKGCGWGCEMARFPERTMTGLCVQGSPVGQQAVPLRLRLVWCVKPVLLQQRADFAFNGLAKPVSRAVRAI